MVLIIFLLFVWQYVTYITAFTTVYDLFNSLYYTLCYICYHFKKASNNEYTITHCRPTHDTVRKSDRTLTATRHQEHN